MYDHDLVLEILSQIYDAIKTIEKRFQPIKKADDFTDSDAGLEKLDAICMQLIAIGESLKNVDKITNKALLSQYTEVEWQKIKGMRDIISHHYFDVDAEIIFDVCKNSINDLEKTIERIIEDLSQQR